MRSPRLAAAACVLAVTATLSACGSDSSSSTAGEQTTSATSPSETVTSPSESPTTSTPSTDEVSGSGELSVADFAQRLQDAQAQAGSAHMEASFSAAGQSLTMQGDFSGTTGDVGALAMNMSLDMGGKTLEMVLVDEVVYINGAGMSTDPQKPWIKVPLGGPNNPLSSLFDTANPENFTAFLQGVKNLEDKGAESVDGVDTHHYVITIDTAEMIKANDMFKGQSMSSLGLPATITSEVWVDANDLPVKMTVPLGNAGSLEAHFSQWGEPVSVEAPPASQVMRMPGMTPSEG